MIVSCLLLIEGNYVKKESLSFSLANAKQIIIGSSNVFGFIVQLAANSTNDLNNAIIQFGTIANVTDVAVLRFHTQA